MQLSKRLERVADFVTEGNVLADIGTDHGYIPIYLVKEGIIPSAYAMDINKGPLERAKEHIAEEGLIGKIETRLSNGLDKLQKDEADTVLIAGMGGALIIDILQRGSNVLETVSELVLSPHSEWKDVRVYLMGNGYVITREEMLIDAGKFYVIMKAVRGEAAGYDDIELRYGRLLLDERNPVLEEYLNIQKRKFIDILDNLKSGSLLSESAGERIVEIEKELKMVEEALFRFG